MAGVAIYRTGIAPDWIDYNGHLRDAYYGLIVSYAIDALMQRIGLDEAGRARTGCTLYTLEMHMHYLREIKASDTVTAELRILGADRKRIHAAFDLLTAAEAQPAASAEVMLLQVQQSPTVSSQPFAPEIAAAIAGLQQATGALPPGRLGSRQMQLPQR
jgi:acyl-CoA thioester hydrolase